MNWVNGSVAALVLVYVVALVASVSGRAYAGHNGYHHGRSFYYMGGPSIYHQPSNRAGSPGGPGRMGGGPRGGK